jgi:hypothetical protein
MKIDYMDKWNAIDPLEWHFLQGHIGAAARNVATCDRGKMMLI